MTQVILPALGSALLLLLAFDVLVTVFHPQGRGGPINRVQNDCVWKAFRLVGRRRDGRRRSTLLAFCGPVLAVLTIVTWGIALITGFVLIYYPFIESFHVSPPTSDTSSPLARAVYYSAYTASTLGIGDVVAPTAALKLLTVVESLSGFILIPISVTYVLAVYRDLSVATTLSLDIYGYFQRGTAQVWEEIEGARAQAFDDWADRTARDLLHVTQAHAQYPILHYFYSADSAQALLVQLGRLVQFRAISESRGVTVSTSPSLDVLRDAVERHLRVINRDVIPERFPPGIERLQEAHLEEWHRRALRYMLYEEQENVARASEP